MSKVLVLLLGVAMTWGLVASLGWLALVGCIVAAFVTVMFSIEVEEQSQSAIATENYSAVASDPVGSF
jgi:hypothetical protein